MNPFAYALLIILRERLQKAGLNGGKDANEEQKQLYMGLWSRITDFIEILHDSGKYVEVVAMMVHELSNNADYMPVRAGAQDQSLAKIAAADPSFMEFLYSNLTNGKGGVREELKAHNFVTYLRTNNKKLYDYQQKLITGQAVD
jgi:hypothetical protein